MNISKNHDGSMTLYLLPNPKEKLLSIGYDNMTIDEKNSLIVFIAVERGLLLNEVTTDFILDYHKLIKVQLLNDKCEEAIVNGFVSSNGHSYRTNRDDQINMIGQKDILANNESIEVVMWKAEDVGYWIEHSRNEWLLMYKEAFEHKQAQLVKYNKLKQDVILAKKHAEILDLNW